jgi:DNA polymerase
MSASEDLLRVEVDSFDRWRSSARRLLICGASPETVMWVDRRGGGRDQQSLLEPVGRTLDQIADDAADKGSDQSAAGVHRVPQSFLDCARMVAHHRSAECWGLLYRMLWRITGGQRHLMEIASDRDVHRARAMQKAVSRDAHKMKAFVRFRKTVQGDGERYVAWHRPDHYVVPVTADFFARRFDVMRWAILTPDQSVFWDGDRLEYGPGCPRSAAPTDDEMESLWKTYYSSIFNPARVKLRAMRAEMPKKHWATMPETALIDSLVRQSPKRVDEMVEKNDQTQGAEVYLPADCKSLSALGDAAAGCRGCDLHREATQTVFGRGPRQASLMLIGEQPGDQEDLAGEPFVGPAGQLLDDVMDQVGLRRDQLYVTNAVKHFKWKPAGKRRLHVKPSSREISACRPWLLAEIEAVRPLMIVCLGATAASVILGPAFRITKQRGVVMKTDFARWTMATYHPSAVLRVPDETSRETMRRLLTEDLTAAADYLRNIIKE